MGKPKPKHEQDLLCDRTEIARTWGTTPNNIGRTFINNPKKSTQLKMLDMATFCMQNNITPELLRMYVRHGKEHTAVLLGTEAQETDNKIVIMNQEEYEQYEKYKIFLKMHESK